MRKREKSMKRLYQNIIVMLFVLGGLAYANPPKRAISTAQFTTEILLSIGAEEKLIGTAYLDSEILPELKEKYDKIPVLSNKLPTKEKFYSQNPDFLTGWPSVLTPANLGPLKELNENGVQVYIMKSVNSNNIEDVFSDILKYGEIFGLQENAQNIVNEMKEDLEKIKNKLPKEKIKVFPYDSGEGVPFVVGGQGIGNTIIELAGGENIFKDINSSFGNGSWEKALVEDPEIILIVDYGDTSYEKKVEYIKQRSILKDLDAVKNNRFIKIELADISSGVRNVKAIKKLAKELHNIEI